MHGCANATTPSTFGNAASRAGANHAAICLITVAEQFTDARMPMKLRDATRPSGRRTMMPSFDRTRTRLHVVGAHPAQTDSEALSVNLHVSARTPPTFLAQAFDDPIAPDDNSLPMASALRAAQVPGELHACQRRAAMAGEWASRAASCTRGRRSSNSGRG